MDGIHVTIKGILHQYGIEYFTNIEGCVIVEHKEGLIQKERPHYHIWLPSSHTIDSTKRALRSYYDTKTSELKWNTHANAYYSVTPHDNFQKWIDYTIDPEKSQVKKPSIQLWNRSEPRPEVRIIDNLVLPGLSIVSPPVATTVKKHQNTLDKQAKFYNFVKEYVSENPQEVLGYTDITGLLYEYSKGGFNEMAAPQYIEFAMYHYLKDSGDTIKSEEVKHSWTTRVMSRLRK